MKKILQLTFAFTILNFSSNLSAKYIEGKVLTRGNHLSCEFFNHSYSKRRVIQYTYHILYKNGFYKDILFRCVNNCNIYSYQFKIFSGPFVPLYSISSISCNGRMRYPRVNA